MRLSAVIFDFDGTIIDTENAEFATWQEVYRTHGQEMPKEIWAQVVGTASGGFDPLAHLEGLLGRPLPRTEIRAARSARDRLLTDAMEARPGVRSLIIAARAAGVSVAIASSSPRDWVEYHLRRLGLLKDFAAIASFDETGRGKPDPAVFLWALQALGIEARDAVAVEDSPNGAIAARRAGIACLVVPNEITAELTFPPLDARRETLAGVTLQDLAALIPEGERG